MSEVNATCELPSDLRAAIENNDVILSGAIVDVLATIDGENDERSWHWIVLVDSDTPCVYITGGCDYTGWDCQSSCDAYEAATMAECLRLVGEAERDVLAAQLPESCR